MSLHGFRENDVNHKGRQEARQPHHHGSVHARDRPQHVLGIDVHKEAIGGAQPTGLNARRHHSTARAVQSVPEVRAIIVSHDLYPKVITKHGIIVVSSPCGRARVGVHPRTRTPGILRTFLSNGEKCEKPLQTDLPAGPGSGRKSRTPPPGTGMSTVCSTVRCNEPCLG